MSSTIAELEQFVKSIEQQRHSACTLLYETAALIEAREILGLTRDVKTHCEEAMTTAADAKTVLQYLVESTCTGEKIYSALFAQLIVSEFPTTTSLVESSTSPFHYSDK
jgi:hypothetical protein